MKIPVIPAKNKKKKLSIEAPAEIFKQKINEELITQAVRVYRFNQRQGNANTKTRSEVKGSRKKIWAQKGTGRARHGDRYAPIFVGGGITHGPKPKDWSLKMPKKMKKKALFSALSAKLKEKKIFVVEGLEKKKPKTKEFAQFFKEKLKFNSQDERLLLLLAAPSPIIERGAGNIENLEIQLAHTLNTYLVLYFDKIIFTKKALKVFKKTFLNS